MLTDAYKASIEDERLKQLLLRRENLPVLEELLAAETEELRQLLKRKKQNVVRDVAEYNLKELFAEICVEVNDFLDVQAEPPQCFLLRSMFENYIFNNGFTSPKPEVVLIPRSHYNPFTQTVFLEQLPHTSLIPIAAHEYAHHLQRVAAGTMYDSHSIFMEGHARGVQKHIAELYQGQEDNPAFLADADTQTCAELAWAQRWLLQELGVLPKRRGFIPPEPAPHAIGNALFRIYEATHGKDI